MRQVIIIGTGAVAAELTSYIQFDNTLVSDENKIRILGYIDYEYNRDKYWKKYNLQYPILYDIDSYQSDEDVEVLIGVSNIAFRNKVIEVLLKKNAIISNYIHSSVLFPNETKIGVGNIIYPFCIIGPNCQIGDYNMITSYSFISHDCIIGDGNFLSTAGLAGRVTVGTNNFFGIRSTVLPSVSIGDNNTIQAGMVVDKSIKDNTTVFYRYKEQVLVIPKEI